MIIEAMLIGARFGIGALVAVAVFLVGFLLILPIVQLVAKIIASLLGGDGV